MCEYFIVCRVQFSATTNYKEYITPYQIYRCSQFFGMDKTIASTASTEKNSFRMNHIFSPSKRRLRALRFHLFVVVFLHLCIPLNKEDKNSGEKICHLTNISLNQTATILKHVFIFVSQHAQPHSNFEMQCFSLNKIVIQRTNQQTNEQQQQ